ncbi:hypothetical protein BX611_1996 [Lutibacter oceani]|uniref:Phytanoyl-CoA dioxygenase n=1 Tax=Lutibacter oceani TaxID=1853311 RepID=A0A3D9RS64_9FLAO|nr:phytanoyl-CoA dioxygenase [Lutibacter oceani]REE80354.1 hypothetical protein BX611_1996 [Lutibacter oceani]
MIKKKIIADIKNLTSPLIKNSSNDDLIKKNLDQIHIHFKNITEISGFDFKIEYLAAIPAAKGKALGLNHAAQCLLDYKRTVKFLTAIILAIQEKQKTHPGELINVFYAGCGPYAPFITLVASFFKPEEIQFNLLEINKTSLESAKKLINTLELSDYVQEFYLADAVTFKIPNPEKFHILISETLDALLYRECYVPILYNLLPQFNKNIILIPENVLINLNLLTHSENSKEFSENKMNTILNVREVILSKTHNGTIPSQLSDKKFDLKLLDLNHTKKILLDTQVQIYKDIFLNRNESSLTIPFEIKLEENSENNFIVFTYFMQPNIELRYNFQ